MNMMKSKLLNLTRQFIKSLFRMEPQNTEDLLFTIKTCIEKVIINPETGMILENTVNLNHLQVRDIMMPKNQMIVLQENASISDIIQTITESGHSRFPVISNQGEHILGILHAKDLLGIPHDHEFDISDILRNANFVPESRKLDALLTDFRKNRNHLAIVVDEYGQPVGFVTLEDTLEQIIGDIADEFDVDEEDPIKILNDKQFIMKGDTELELINERLGTQFSDEHVDTIGGLVTSHFNYPPKRGEIIQINEFQFRILSASSRRIKLLECLDKRPNEATHEP